MTHTAIMKLDGVRVAKYMDFATEAEAQAHVSKFSADFPSAFVTATQNAPVRDWHVVGQTVTLQPIVIPVEINEVKAEAERRILSIMDKNKQRNLLALGLEMVMAHGADPVNWPEPERTLLTDTLTKWAEIKAIRAKSNALEQMDPIPQDYTADFRWQ